MNRYALTVFSLAICLTSVEASAQEEAHSDSEHPGVTAPTMLRENTVLQPFASRGANYPVEASARSEEAQVSMAATITKEGYPINCRVVSHNDPVFNTQSLEYCSSRRFNPATKNGIPVDYPNHIMNIHYELSQTK